MPNATTDMHKKANADGFFQESVALGIDLQEAKRLWSKKASFQEKRAAHIQKVRQSLIDAYKGAQAQGASS